ncbi:MAG: hypothetical protein ACXWCM_12975 [Acidimicrobiales bacterium]
MSAVVVDTGVFSAPLLARRKVGQALEEKYRRHDETSGAACNDEFAGRTRAVYG